MTAKSDLEIMTVEDYEKVQNEAGKLMEAK